MTDNEYLERVLEAQTLKEDGDELKELRRHREDVENLLLKKFKSAIIRYGGSKAKGTMILEAYDLDIICYFENGDTSAGDSLKDVYYNVKSALQDDYMVEEKPSALRLKGCDKDNPDFHIDVVPGRFTGEDKQDAFIYRSSGEKGRQKTNLQKHIDHVSQSGVQGAIRLLKLWRSRNGLSVKHFILELVAIDLLDGKSDKLLTEQLEHVWTDMRDNIDDMMVEDPANPQGNDLSELFNSSIKLELKTVAEDALADIDSKGWQTVFGQVDEPRKAEKLQALLQAPSIITGAPKPWLSGE